MTPLLTVATEHAYAESVGDAGVPRAQVAALLPDAQAKLTALLRYPGKSAAPLIRLPARQDDLAAIRASAEALRAESERLLLVGMGGSSLSGEALAALASPGGPQLRVIDNIDPVSSARLLADCDWQRTSCLLISKSGRTIETLAQAAVLLRAAKAAGVSPRERFLAITVAGDNPLRALAAAEGFAVLDHDPDLGGRFSLFSNVGLLPAAYLGIDIQALREGAASQLTASAQHPAIENAAILTVFARRGLRLQVSIHYADALAELVRWYRQCWAESIGKDTRASTLIRNRGATDQHSQLQLYLDGPNDKYFTAWMLDMQGQGAQIHPDALDDPRLEAMRGRSLGDLMMAEQRATLESLVARGRPVRALNLSAFSPCSVGALMMYLMIETVLSAEMMGIDAYNQPAVERGKQLTEHYLRRGQAAPAA